MLLLLLFFLLLFLVFLLLIVLVEEFNFFKSYGNGMLNFFFIVFGVGELVLFLICFVLFNFKFELLLL